MPAMKTTQQMRDELLLRGRKEVLPFEKDSTQMPIPSTFGGLRTAGRLFHGGTYQGPIADKQGAIVGGRPATSFTRNPYEALEYASQPGGKVVSVSQKGLRIYRGGNPDLDKAYMAEGAQAVARAGYDGVDVRALTGGGYNEVVVWNHEKVKDVHTAPVETRMEGMALAQPFQRESSKRTPTQVVYHGSPHGPIVGQPKLAPHDETGIPGFSVSREPETAHGYAYDILRRHEVEDPNPSLTKFVLHGKVQDYSKFLDDLENYYGTKETSYQDLLNYAKKQGIVGLDHTKNLGIDEISVLFPDALQRPKVLLAAGGSVQQMRDELLLRGMAGGGEVSAGTDWRSKLVGGGIRGIITRGLLGMDPPEDMTPGERDIYENMVRLSAPAQGLGVGKAIFIGAKAKTWNKAAADQFLAMEKAGVRPEQIWRETGTFRSADGKLRQEISDVGALHRNPAQLQELGKAKKEEARELQLRMVTPIGQKDLFPKALTEAKKPAREQVAQLKAEADELMRPADVRGQSARFVLEHPELYKAYPELANIPVMQGVSGSGRGSLIGGGSGLQMEITQQGLRFDPRSTTLHEMQHAVQHLEDMAPGGSPAMAFLNPKAHEILQQLRAKASTPMSFEQFVEQYGTNANNAARYQEYLKNIPQTVAGMDRQLQHTAAMQYYNRLAGEAEARATQFRERMGPTRRAQEFPYSSYDVLPEDLIVNPPHNIGYAKGGAVPTMDEMRLKVWESKFPQMGINVATDKPAGLRYADLIVDGKKKYESRDSDSLRPYVGKRVAIVRTGEGTAKAIGAATVGEPMLVDEAKFRAMRRQHLVPEGSKFDIKSEQKYLYPMLKPERFEAEQDVGHGIVARRLLPSKE